jgi:hypothetical protein
VKPDPATAAAQCFFLIKAVIVAAGIPVDYRSRFSLSRFPTYSLQLIRRVCPCPFSNEILSVSIF